MKVIEAAKWIENELADGHEIAECAAISRTLLLHHFNEEPKNWLKIQQTVIPPSHISLLTEQIKRLQQHEPLQYVLAEAWFCNLNFTVGPGVLIPRPETEELVEWVTSHCRFPIQQLSLLDIGTGSGCIAIALKRRIRAATVWAIDKSTNALDIAKNNARRLGTPISFKEMDILDETQWENLPAFDLIISNPPYIPVEEKVEMAKQVLDFEPPMALFAINNDPLLFYKKITSLFLLKKNKGAQLFFELNPKYALAIAQLFQESGLQVELKMDMQGKNRMIRGWLN